MVSANFRLYGNVSYPGSVRSMFEATNGHALNFVRGVDSKKTGG